MFGKAKKTMSAANRFVIAEGMRRGNMPPPMKNDGVKKTAPLKRASSPREQLGTIKVKQ